MTTISAALHDLLNEPDLPLEAAVSRHFTDAYRQRTDNEWSDRAGFVEHIAHLRALVARVEIDVRDEFIRDRCYADRHIVHLTKRDGSTVTQEVYLFGELAEDGRFRRAEEVTLMLAGGGADRAIGRAR